jgi:hypothetical protein
MVGSALAERDTSKARIFLDCAANSLDLIDVRLVAEGIRTLLESSIDLFSSIRVGSIFSKPGIQDRGVLGWFEFDNPTEPHLSSGHKRFVCEEAIQGFASLRLCDEKSTMWRYLRSRKQKIPSVIASL